MTTPLAHHPRASRRFARWPLFGAALLVGILACDADPYPERMFHEDFERACDGSPCGWERTMGDPDQALWVETFHPGEHALRLTAPVAVRRTNDSLVESVSGGLELRAAARCEGGASIQVDVVILDMFGLPETTSTTLRPGTEWTGPFEVPLAFRERPVGSRVQTVVLRVVGGTCEIDELVIDDLGDSVSC